MTRKQYEFLIDIHPNGSGSQSAALQWLYIRLIKGLEEGAFGNANLEDTLTAKILDLQDSMDGIRHSLKGNIPLAYAHFVQVLVDSFFVLAPFGLYPEMGLWSALAVGLLTLFYGGMLDLSKVLLFPMEDDDTSFCKETAVNMDVDVLIRDTNVEWIQQAEARNRDTPVLRHAYSSKVR